MLLWINGALRGGKTATASELGRRTPRTEVERAPHGARGGEHPVTADSPPVAERRADLERAFAPW